MAEIIPFPRKEDVIYHLFNYHMRQYVLIYFIEKKEVTFAEATLEGDRLYTKHLPKEKIQELYEEVFPYFFLKLRNKGKEAVEDFVLLVYFTLDDKTYTVYYNQRDRSDLVILQIKDNTLQRISNEFENKRAKKYFLENFDVQWLT